MTPLPIHFPTPPLLATSFLFIYLFSNTPRKSSTPHFTYHQRLFNFLVFCPPQNLWVQQCYGTHEQCMNSVFVLCTVKSCDFTVHAQGKKKKKIENAKRECHFQLKPNKYYIFLSILGSQIYYLSLQYHHWFLLFLSFSLKIYRYNSKMLISMPSINIQSFSLSQAQPILIKKTLLQQSVRTINRSEKKEDFYCKKKVPLQIPFSNFTKLVQPYQFLVLRLNQVVFDYFRFLALFGYLS